MISSMMSDSKNVDCRLLIFLDLPIICKMNANSVKTGTCVIVEDNLIIFRRAMQIALQQMQQKHREL